MNHLFFHKIPLLFIALLLLSASGLAQKTFPLKTLNDSARFQLAVREGQLALQWIGTPPNWQKERGFPEIRDVRLEESDLVVEYVQGATNAQYSYTFSLKVSADDGPIVAPSGYEISEAPAGDSKDKLLRRHTWQNAAEALFIPGRSYTLHLRRDLMGAVNCTDERPRFMLNRQLPYYGAALAGLASSGIGLYLFKRADDEYDQYKQFWADARSAKEAEDFLTKADRFNKNGQILLYSGLAVTGVDALLYCLKLRKIRGNQATYDKFCGQKTSFWELRPTASPSTSGFAMLGARFAWHF